MTRRARVLALAASTVLVWSAPSAPERRVEIVATGVPRPLQLALDREGALVILSPGDAGDSAGEIFRVGLEGAFPVDLARAPSVRIPFAAGPRKAVLGSLAIDPDSGALFLGEENGTRIYRLSSGSTLTLYALGIHRLGGGATLAFDTEGRLLIVDYVDYDLPSTEEPSAPGFEWLRDEDYKGPLLFRLDLDPAVTPPRDLGRGSPLFPRAWGGKAGGGLLPRLISVAAGPSGGLFVLSSMGEVFRVTPEAALRPIVKLPLGQYHRTNMIGAPDGGVLVSGGFHVGRVFHVSGDGAVTTLAGGLADPQGLALDPAGYVYIAESALHRIIRVPLR